MVKKIEKDLDVIVSSNLKQTMHVSEIVKRAEMALSILKKTVISEDKKVFLNPLRDIRI